jgi:hypothetical protein
MAGKGHRIASWMSGISCRRGTKYVVDRSLAAITRPVHSIRRGPRMSCARKAAASAFEPIAKRCAIALNPRPAICGKTNHIQWLCLRASGRFVDHLRVDAELGVDEAPGFMRVCARLRHREGFHADRSGPLVP